MTNEILTLVVLFLALFVVLWQAHCLKANSRSYFEARDRQEAQYHTALAETTDRHIRDLLTLSKEYSRVLKKSRAWKKTAKKYYKGYKEKANV